MTNTDDSSAPFACPRCDRTPLEARESELHCGGCKVSFPIVGGIPWLFAEPGAAFAEWQARWQFALKLSEQRVARIDRALAAERLRVATRARLEKRRTTENDHRKRLAALLAPVLGVDTTAMSFATYLALRTRLPPDQGLLTYYNNVHRDWSWGEEENAASLALVQAVHGERQPARALVLGAGAGRLAYDFHMATGAAKTIALDFNPLLTLIGHRISTGETLELFEFPLAPSSVDNQAQLRQLGAPEAAKPGLEWVTADVHRPPFAPRSFDTIITPWLIDIVPERLDDLTARINHLLGVDGVWINFGSLSFEDAEPAAQYGLDECEEIVRDGGFDSWCVESRTIPYMSSPASRHGRRETVVAWSAVKRSNANRVPRYEALPDWLVRGQAPVPLSQAIRTQAMAAQVHGFLLSLIDGKRSLKDIAKIAVERKLVPPAEAESTIRSFLIKVYDEGKKIGV